MRFWLLTNTTYGSWLPGDARGSVTSVRDRRAGESPSTTRREHDQPGEAWEPALAGLRQSAAARLKRPPIRLTPEQAGVLADQFRETAAYRGWRLLAAAIMANHFHLVVGVFDDHEPRKMLVDFKAYGSRALNRRYGKPASGKWWTANGSKRKLPDERAVRAAIYYVLHKQANALVTWNPSGEP